MEYCKKHFLPVLILIITVLSFSLLACTDDAVGHFYSLEEAYDNGLISDEDVKNIAYYYRDVTAGGGLSDEERSIFEPSAKCPDEPNDLTIEKIKKTYARDILKNNRTALGRISIEYYYGTYNGNVVVNVTDDYRSRDLLFIDEITIGNTIILHYCPSIIRVWVVLGESYEKKSCVEVALC